jgi:serine/threonine protein phosphatase PrpC
MSLNVVSTGAPTACGLKHGKNQDRQVRGRCRSRRTSLLCCGHTRLARLHRCLLTFQRTACSYVCDARSACFGRFCAVFDGHGGEAAAMLAARRLLTFAEARTADSGGNAEALGRALACALADCEHALALAAASQRSDPGGAVAVAAAVLPSAPPTLLLAWAGDATALLLRRCGAVRLTREHTLAEPSELRRVLLSGGEVVPQRTPADAARVKRCDANDLEHRVVPTRGIGDLQQGQPNAVISPQPEVRALPLSACARRPQGGKRSGGCCAPRPRHGRLHRGGGISRMRRRVMTRGRRGTSIMRHHLCGDLSNAWRRVMPSRPRPAAHHA